MRQTPFVYDPMTYEEAESLIARYASRNVVATKTLAHDPRLWIVTVILPESLREPRIDRRYQQKHWT